MLSRSTTLLSSFTLSNVVSRADRLLLVRTWWRRSELYIALQVLYHRCSLQNVRAVAAGGAHTAAVTEGSVYSWGSNSAGQLGSRTFRDKAAPTEVKDLAGKGVAQVACGAEHSLFLLRCAALPQLRLQGSVARRCDNGLRM